MNDDPRPRRTVSAGARYASRFSWGMGLYASMLVIALVLRNQGVGSWQPMLLTLPGIAVIVGAVLAYYREADELEQRRLGESVVVGFAIGVPVLLVIGLLESFGGPHLNWMIAFVILMAGWLVGSIVSAIRYR